jgi:hypothetical protein
MIAETQLLFYKISSHPLFSALLMGLMNIGGRYIAADIPKKFEAYLASNMFMRKLIWFAIFFIASRDWKVALLAVLGAHILFHYLLKDEDPSIHTEADRSQSSG